ncbi:hypothetical protein, partial [Asanoa sp. NPDC050611]|uniref:hypothetical protein n=1 Tax=Asanoa sp. NPDC050611 TaxID=3157098 RepID=UPI0033D91909
MTIWRADGQTTGYRTEGCVVDEGGSAAVDGQRPVRAEASLLGPVRLLADGVAVPLPEPARDVLGVLALRPGETVTAEQIGSALWTVPRQRGAGAGERVETAVAA